MRQLPTSPPTPIGEGPFFGYLILVFIVFTGIDNDLAFLKAMRFTTLLAYSLALYVIVRTGAREIRGQIQTKLFVTFLVFTMLSVLWAVVRIRAFNSIQAWIDGMVFYCLTYYLVDRPRRVQRLALTLLAAVALLLFRNFSRLGSEVRLGRFNAPYFMGDGNDFAWCLLVLLPIFLYLVLSTRTLLMRAAGALGLVLCLVGVIGTGSRGASLGLAAAFLFYWIFMARNKSAGILVIAVAAVGVAVMAPASYFSRMQTVASYEQDNSAQARLQAWGISIRMAVDHPLGVGADNFASAYGRYYLPNLNRSSVGWGASRWISAHSIYFKTLGEYGFLGLGILLWLVLRCLLDNVATRRRMLLERRTEGTASILAGVLTMSIVGYAVAGVFLGGLTYPHIFFLAGLTIAAARIAEAEVLPPATDSSGSRIAVRRRQQLSKVGVDLGQ